VKRICRRYAGAPQRRLEDQRSWADSLPGVRSRAHGPYFRGPQPVVIGLDTFWRVLKHPFIQALHDGGFFGILAGGIQSRARTSRGDSERRFRAHGYFDAEGVRAGHHPFLAGPPVRGGRVDCFVGVVAGGKLSGPSRKVRQNPFQKEEQSGPPRAKSEVFCPVRSPSDCWLY